MRRALILSIALLAACTPNVEEQIAQVEASKRQVIAERFRRQSELQAQLIESPREMAGEIRKTYMDVERTLQQVEAEQLRDLNRRLAELKAKR